MPEEKDLKEWEKYDETIEKFIQVIAKNMNLYGITSSVGRLYGVLYFSDNPMTLDDMRDALEMSKTSMSTGVRTLSDMKMVESTFKKGIRKDLYRSEEDWYKSFTSLFGNRWRQYTETNIEEADETIAELEQIISKTDNEDLKEKIKSDIDRLEYAKNYYEWLMTFIQVIESGKIFDYIPKK
ncbi:GbsR/MarR family transcriptional regulator [Virgibacillus halodenitrificans]|uniref:HTH-type transcriptional regulator n=1 Tax=Virgibacillus halodenitrificans TaxID=1482 RepID=A0AAC9IYL5_VIRHA|nr:transcriptional regulator [Virgibacillus halodenitrificans]APC47427.1 GbsR/MarR family transcriptional regulator [Virgibacillus halodenitrificans]MCG1029469.1 GbsR/MarR family transcriptional regulator [Virgibacillus halodenitrificans]MCJ0932245.1 GbsR/MarR family transcriptional regulator [Virgibacillus halodenitrificans]MEC2160697.1 GbsR/MarR family transcriptional regulator [Virgibacillus halodenitrificans]MYL46236.1 GbsR/MarR family transcriptional regulator [Virgibacillus halodenitrifi